MGLMQRAKDYTPNPRAARVRETDDGWIIELLDQVTAVELTALVCAFDLEVDGINEAEDIVLRPTYPIKPAPTQKEVEEAIAKGPRRGLAGVQ